MHLIMQGYMLLIVKAVQKKMYKMLVENLDGQVKQTLEEVSLHLRISH